MTSLWCSKEGFASGIRDIDSAAQFCFHGIGDVVVFFTPALEVEVREQANSIRHHGIHVSYRPLADYAEHP